MSPTYPLPSLGDEDQDQNIIDQSSSQANNGHVDAVLGAHQASTHTLPPPTSMSTHPNPSGFPFGSIAPHHQPQPEQRNTLLHIDPDTFFTTTGSFSFFNGDRFHPNGYGPSTSGSNYWTHTRSILPKMEPSTPPRDSWGLNHTPDPQYGARNTDWQNVLQQVVNDSSSNDPADDDEQLERNYATATLNPGSASQPAPTTLAFARSITSVQKAKTQLYQKTVIYRKLKIDDDVDAWTEERILEYAKKLFDAVIQKSPVAPSNHTDEEKAKYRKSQELTLEKCKMLLTTNEGVKDASARCLLTINEIVKLHRDGVPSDVVRNEDKAAHATKSEDNKQPSLKTNGGYRIDLVLKCGARIQKIIDEALKTKLVAVHILTGDQLMELICAPDGFAARKRSNFRGNHKKQVQMTDGREAKKHDQVEGEETMASVEDTPTKSEKSKPKRKSSVVGAAVADEVEDVNVEPEQLPSVKRVKRSTSAQDVEPAHKI